MTRPRRQLIAVEDTPYYHCVSRCVRRAFLCGKDDQGHCFEHRRGWIIERIKFLASIFSIDVAAYAIMNNHYHLVLRIDAQQPKEWSDLEIIERWLSLFKGPDIIQRHLKEPLASPAELAIVDSTVHTWRERLSSISWFMKCLNEHIARKANREDHCTGHFWESRFKSQALLDQAALLTCMAYIDLNPIRASMAKTPETSDYTSIQERLGITPSTPEAASEENKDEISLPQAELLAFAGWQNHNANPKHLPFSLMDYAKLVDYTGRCIRSDKRGAIAANTPKILQRLKLAPDKWLAAATGIESQFHHAIGPLSSLNQLCERLHQRWLHGQNACKQLYLH